MQECEKTYVGLTYIGGGGGCVVAPYSPHPEPLDRPLLIKVGRALLPQHCMRIISLDHFYRVPHGYIIDRDKPEKSQRHRPLTLDIDRVIDIDTCRNKAIN